MKRKRNKEYDKLYRAINKEKLNQQNREYYAENKEWIASKRNNKKQSARIKKYYKENPDKRRTAELKYLYGITLDDYNNMLIKQNNRCAICSSTKNLSIDHDHSKKKGDERFVRGILCNSCNTSLGVFGDNIEGLEKAISYLRGDDLN